MTIVGIWEGEVPLVPLDGGDRTSIVQKHTLRSYLHTLREEVYGAGVTDK